MTTIFRFRHAQWVPWASGFLALVAMSSNARGQFDRLKKLAPPKVVKEVQKGAEAFTPMSTDQERELGREVSAKIIAGLHIYRNDALTRYVNLVGDSVAAQSERKDIQYHFAVLDSDEINALSAPGGYVFITRAALMLCQDESQLAGVLAHEVGHISGKHVVHIFENEKKKSGVASVASDYAPGSPYLQSLTNNFLVMIFNGGLPADDEFDADRRGTQYAHDAGYPADGLQKFLAQLNIATTQKGAETTITNTHPPVKDRTDRIQQIIANKQWQDADKPPLADRYTTLTAMLRTK